MQENTQANTRKNTKKEIAPGIPARIEKSEIEHLPLIQFEESIHLVETPEQLEYAIKVLNQEQVIGFDTETRPSFTKGKQYQLSLLQLSTKDQCFLIRLNLTPFSQSLIDLFHSSKILKIGLAIQDDIRALNRIKNFKPNGFVDLSSVSRKMGVITCGLRSITGLFLKAKLSKKERLSNWERKELTSSQQIYAATDAWICRVLYLHLKQEGFIP